MADYNNNGGGQNGRNRNGYNQGGQNQGGYNRGGQNQGGYNQGGYNQGGQNQGGCKQGGYNQGGYNQRGYNQGGYNQGGQNQGGYNQGGYNQGGYNQGGYKQGGYNQGGYNQGGYNQGGQNQGGYNRGSQNQGGYRQGGSGQGRNSGYPTANSRRSTVGGGYSDGPDDDGGKRKSNIALNIITSVILVVALAVFGFAAYTLYGYYKDYKVGEDEYDSLNDKYVDDGSGREHITETATEDDGSEVVKEVLSDVEELEDPETLPEKLETAAEKEARENGEKKVLPRLVNPIDFEELHGINEDIIGWIRIGALNLSYPVCQAKDNDYYLHRTFERVDNFAGCIFLNCDNSRYFTDQNSIVYGHNMKNGSMFGTLKKFSDQEVYDSNPYFWIFTEEFIYQYRIFSCRVVSASGDPYATRFTTEEFRAFLEECQKNSAIENHGVELDTDDRITTLSTCTGDSSTRYIVQGKLETIYVAE